MSEGKEELSFADFERIYQEFEENNLSSKLQLSSITPNDQPVSSNKPSQEQMIHAIRTFDHQGTGFISQSELKFSKNQMKDFIP